MNQISMNQDQIIAREKILSILNSKIISKNFKFILTSNVSGSVIELRVLKNSRLSIANLTFFSIWQEIRIISGEDYLDILYKIEKYPKYIETETEVKLNESQVTILD